MVQLKSGDIDRFLARPDPGVRLALIYGEDEGLVAERGERVEVDRVRRGKQHVRMRGIRDDRDLGLRPAHVGDVDLLERRTARAGNRDEGHGEHHGQQ